MAKARQSRYYQFTFKECYVCKILVFVNMVQKLGWGNKIMRLDSKSCHWVGLCKLCSLINSY